MTSIPALVHGGDHLQNAFKWQAKSWRQLLGQTVDHVIDDRAACLVSRQVQGLRVIVHVRTVSLDRDRAAAEPWRRTFQHRAGITIAKMLPTSA